MTTPAFLPDVSFLQEPRLQRLLVALNHPHEAGLTRVVGGAVRNVLMGQAVGDIDCATRLSPQQVMERMQASGFRTVATGLRFGTVTVVVDGKPFEVTTLRRDLSSDGRWADVSFEADFTDDARRRDFTMNALYCDLDGRLHDPLDGYADVMARRVRFIGDPHARIAEDYLRVLRFFRFHAWYGCGVIDAAGFRACTAARVHMRQLSAERLQRELLKLLVAPNAFPSGAVMGISQLADSGVLIDLIGVPMIGELARLMTLEEAQRVSPSAIRRLGVLAIRVEEDVARVAARLRLSRLEKKTLEAIASWAQRLADHPHTSLCRQALEACGTFYGDVVLAAWAKAGALSQDCAWQALAALPQTDPVPPFPVKGADLMALGLGEGVEIGHAMGVARRAWVDSDFRLDRQALLTLVRQARA